MAASRAGHAKMVHYICMKRAPSATEVTAAIQAAIKADKGQAETVKELLGFNITLFFSYDDPLIIASEKGYTEIVAMLFQNTMHDTFLIERSLGAAVRGNHVSCARAILDSQAEGHIDRLSLCTRSILFYLPDMSREILIYFLGLGVHPDTRDPQSDATLLYMAAAGGNYQGVETLIAYGADICLERKGHGTALHAAVEGGWKKVTELLLAAGADVNSKCENLKAPLAVVMTESGVFPAWRSIGINVF